MLDSMVNVIERLNGQIVILNRTLYTLAIPYQFPYRRLIQAREVRGRHRGQPGLRGDPVRLLARSAGRLAGADLRDRRPARATTCWTSHEVERASGRSCGSRTRRWPMRSRGPRASASSPPGQVSELSGRTIRIVGTFKLGINSQSNGNLIMSDRNLLRYFPDLAGPTAGENAVTVGVLRVRPGADLVRRPRRRPVGPAGRRAGAHRATSSSPRSATSGTRSRRSAPSSRSAW